MTPCQAIRPPVRRNGGYSESVDARPQQQGHDGHHRDHDRHRFRVGLLALVTGHCLGATTGLAVRCSSSHCNTISFWGCRDATTRYADAAIHQAASQPSQASRTTPLFHHHPSPNASDFLTRSTSFHPVSTSPRPAGLTGHESRGRRPPNTPPAATSDPQGAVCANGRTNATRQHRAPQCPLHLARDTEQPRGMPGLNHSLPSVHVPRPTTPSSPPPESDRNPALPPLPSQAGCRRSCHPGPPRTRCAPAGPVP